jgi:hypothetical protein
MKNVKNQISNKVALIQDKYISEQVVKLRMPTLIRPSDEAIRQYAKQNSESFSLIDFADWIINNSHQ